MPMVAYSALDRLDRSTANEDPLGFFTFATRLADEWLPGITTRTRRIRYYAMVCGGLHLIEEEFRDVLRVVENRDAEITRLFMRWERLWAVWNTSVATDRSGMIGKNKVSALFKDEKFASRSVDYSFIQRQSDLGALGAYRSSMVDFGLLCKDRVELTYDGETLGEMFWNHGVNRRAWNQSVRVLGTGSFLFPRWKHQLAEYGERFGLDRDPLKKEKTFLRSRLVPAGDGVNRRSRLLDYIRKRGWGHLDEYDILVSAARRGASTKHQSEALERCAATIVALEEFRTATLGLLNTYRDLLYESGHSESPKIITKARTQPLSDNLNRTHRDVLRCVRSGEFGAVFQDFPMADCHNGQNAEAWLRDLLQIHKNEMVKRRTPRWFLPTGGDRWTLDVSVAGPSTDEDGPGAYSYRTSNLLSMARETGCRV